jgi:hypothetical protein
MSESHTAAHAESATDLYNLWQGWLDATDIHASAFEGVEDRLRSSLDHCACALRMDEPVDESSTQPKKEPTKEADCFVFLASHIGSPRPATSDAGYGLAYRWLAQDAGKSAAAEAALSLYPPTDNTTLFTLYSEQESLRPALFRIFRKQIQAIPVAMVNTAATAETSADALKIEALRYAAANADIGMDVFRTHYLPLLSGKTNFNTRIMEVAIWGGMLRSDPDASRAISVALSHTHSPQYRTQLLRLAALTGAAEYLPLLLNAAESDPDTGYPLLVLFGQKSVMPELLKALEIAHTMEQAAAAFSQLSDQMLPRVPRLTVVDEEEDDAEDDAQRIPDVRAARDWWDKHQAKWQAGERWLFGKPANAVHLTAMSKKHAGSFGRDLMALLALAQKAPLNIPTEIWRARQQQLLADKMAAQPAAQATNQPAKARKA